MSPAAVKESIDIIRSWRRYAFFMIYGLAQLSYIVVNSINRGIIIIIYQFHSAVKLFAINGQSTIVLTCFQNRAIIYISKSSKKVRRNSLLVFGSKCIKKYYLQKAYKKLEWSSNKTLTHLLITNTSCQFTLLMLYYNHH